MGPSMDVRGDGVILVQTSEAVEEIGPLFSIFSSSVL